MKNWKKLRIKEQIEKAVTNMICPNCGSSNTELRSGSLGYLAISCISCGIEQDLSNFNNKMYIKR